MEHLKGKCYLFDGEPRRVIGFDGAGRLITTRVDSLDDEELDGEDDEAAKAAEEAAGAADADPGKADPEHEVTTDGNGNEVFKCSVCDKECASLAGLSAHKRAAHK